MKCILSVILAASALWLTTNLPAQNLLLNGDFEASPAPGDSLVPEWTITGSGHIHEATEGATTGTKSAAFNIGGDSQGTVLSQSFATTAGTLYRLAFDAGVFGQPSAAPLAIEATVFGSGGQTLANRTVYPPDAFTFDSNLVQFRHYELTFTANSSTTVLQFADQGLGNGAADTLLDTVSVVAIPTPPPNRLVNGNFETGPFDTVGVVTGWNVGGSGFVSDQSGEGAISPAHSAAFNVAGDSQGNTLAQSFATTPGTEYLVDFDAGVAGQPTGPLQLQVQVVGASTLLDQTVTPPVTGAGLTDFQHYHYTFTADSPTTTLRFTDTGLGNGSADIVVDSVSVVTPATPTPTPSASPSPTATPAPTATPRPTITPTPSPSASATPTATPTPTVTATPTPTATPRPTPTPTPRPSPTATPTPRPSPTATPTPRPSPTPTPTPRPSPTPTATPSVRISSSDNRISEGETVTITFSLSSKVETPTTVRYSLSGTAVPGHDYTLSGTGGQVVIPPGQLSAAITLKALNDNVVEKQETAIVTVLDGAKGKDFVKIFIEKQKTTGRGHR